MATTVFISSTCYDLIDLRAELDSQLRGLGLTPVMSDRPSSEFEVSPSANSIESCLANVRRADVVLVVLSQRYGPSLACAGFEDVSATHLEYREAVQAGKPVHVYVRDRLEADYNLWKRNHGRNVALGWVKQGDDGIFSLIEEHKALAAEQDKSNWVWVFRDSVELKSRVARDLQTLAGKAVLEGLLQSGKVAFLLLSVVSVEIEEASGEATLHLLVTNAGTAVAIQPYVTLYDAREQCSSLRSLLPGQEAAVQFRSKLSAEELQQQWVEVDLDCCYATPDGHYISDDTSIGYGWDASGWKEENTTHGYRGKTYYHSKAIELRSFGGP